MYERSEKPKAANAFIALIAENVKVDEVEVWPENWPAFTVFCSMQTQWRVGMGGATGLDYSALYPLLDRVTKAEDEWDEMFADIQLLEREALAAMNEKD